MVGGLEELEIILNCQLFGSILVWIPGLKVTETSEQREGEGSNCAPRIFSPSITSLTNPKLA